jgi:hypothetical protein
MGFRRVFDSGDCIARRSRSNAARPEAKRPKLPQQAEQDTTNRVRSRNPCTNAERSLKTWYFFSFKGKKGEREASTTSKKSTAISDWTLVRHGMLTLSGG